MIFFFKNNFNSILITQKMVSILFTQKIMLTYILYLERKKTVNFNLLLHIANIRNIFFVKKIIILNKNNIIFLKFIKLVKIK